MTSIVLPDDHRSHIECDSCGKPGPPNRCARCHCTYYCSAACQKKHWKTGGHKIECQPVELFMPVARDNDNERQLLTDDNQLGKKIRAPIAKENNNGSTSTVTESNNNSACGICLEETMTNPFTLPDCKHVFCFACLKEWQGYHNIDPSLDYKGKSLTMIRDSCPLCRKTVQKSIVIDTLETAFAYLDQAEQLEVDDAERPQLYMQCLRECDKILAAEPDDLRTLTYKAQAQVHIEPLKAIETCKHILELDREGHATQAKVKLIKSKLAQAMQCGNFREADKYAAKLNDHILTHKKIPVSLVGEDNTQGHARLYPLRLIRCEAYEAAGKWEESLAEYTDMFRHPDHDQVLQIYRTMKGMSRSLYHLRRYNDAYQIAMNAMLMDRRFMGVHKLAAMAQKELGVPHCLDYAIRTMHRGILYEAPFSESNRQINKDYLQELLAMKDTAAATAAGDS